MLDRRKLGLANFEHFIFLLYSFFIKLRYIFYLLFILPFRILLDFLYIIFLLIVTATKEKSGKVLFDILEVFYEKAYIEYIYKNIFRMNFYLFLYLLPQKKLNCRKELILLFEKVREQKYQEYTEKLKHGYIFPNVSMYLYPRSLEDFFSKYRFIKMIGFYNYFIKKKRTITFDS